MVEVDRVQVVPAQQTMVEGEVFTARAAPRGAGGEALSGRTIFWAVQNPSIVALSGGVGGQVEITALTAGQTTVRATSEGRTGEVQITVLEGPSLVLGVDTARLSARQGQVTAGLDVGISNGGNGAISGLTAQVSYDAGGPTGWLSVGLNGTTVPTSLTLVGSAATLVPGTYGGTVRITSPAAGGLAVDLRVEFVVSLPPPIIKLDAESVGLNAVFGSTQAASQELGIDNGGAGVLTGLTTAVVYESGGPTGWLSVNLSSTQAPARLTISASPKGLAAGTYAARIEVRSPVALVSPVILQVSFRVALPRGGPVSGRSGGSP